MEDRGVEIRKGRPADRDGIWNVFLTSALGLCGTHYEAHEVLAWTRSSSPEAFAEAILSKETLVAEDDGRVIAFGQFNTATSEVEALFVAPPFTGAGIGRRILRAFEALASSHGSTWMQVGSTLNAVGFFEKEGYKQARMEQLHLSDGSSLHRIRMSKSFPVKA